MVLSAYRAAIPTAADGDSFPGSADALAGIVFRVALRARAAPPRKRRLPGSCGRPRPHVSANPGVAGRGGLPRGNSMERFRHVDMFFYRVSQGFAGCISLGRRCRFRSVRARVCGPCRGRYPDRPRRAGASLSVAVGIGSDAGGDVVGGGAAGQARRRSCGCKRCAGGTPALPGSPPRRSRERSERAEQTPCHEEYDSSEKTEHPLDR